MSPDPDPLQPLTDIWNINYFKSDWCNLAWSPWVPFSAAKEEYRAIPKEPGLYRIRPAGKEFLMYIGETRRTVHELINELRQTLKRKNLMPWNDPHIAAPSLWAWQDAEGYEYECSATPLDASQNVRRGMEIFLLYRYRQEYGESTLCNFGRFHKRYRKSTNRKEEKRGGKLEEIHRDNPAGSPSIAPLPVIGSPGGPGWMGLAWSERKPLDTEPVRNVPPGEGLYLLTDVEFQDIIYIGQSINCQERLMEHRRKLWDEKGLHFSYHLMEKPVPSHHLKELENDLVGNYFEVFRKAPAFQFKNQH